jgi:diguanylate cyclase (GGDEF)-like protein/PAS domain S-box-containing protein
MTVLSPFILLLLGASALSWYLSLRSWRGLKAPGSRLFAAMLLGTGAWCLFYALEITSADLGTKTAFAELQYVGIVTIPVFWLLFSMRFTGLDGAFTRRHVAFLLTIPSLTLLLLVTNQVHHLVWSSVELDPSGASAALAIGHGPVFWVWWTYAYVHLVAGVAILIRAALRYPRAYREQAGLIVTAVAIPWIANLVYAADLAPTHNLDPTPFAFAATGGIIALALSRHRLLDVFLGLQSRARGAIFETMPDGVVVLDQDDRIIDSNPAAAYMMGSGLAEFVQTQVGAAPTESLSGSDSPGTFHREVSFLRGDESRILDMLVTSLGKVGVARSGRLVVLRDITERRRAQQAVLEGERRYRTLVDNAHDLILTLDKDGILTSVNAASEKVTGYSRRELLGRNLAEFCVTQEPTDSKPLPLLPQANERQEVRLLSKDGRGIVLEASVRDVLEGGEIAGYECIARDVTDSRLWEDALKFQALHDSITSLPNRMYLRERLADLIHLKEHGSEPFALFVLDLDQFKNINDGLGHQSGDALLQAVAGRLSGTIRPADTVARWGGDEFALVVCVRDIEEARRVGHRICDVFRNPFMIEGRNLALSASVGVAMFPAHGSTVDGLLSYADMAMYAAKQAGGARCAVHDVDGNHFSPDRLALHADIRAAFSQAELILHYQPLIDLRNGDFASFEALVRWNHPRRGLILPSEFLDVLERDGLSGRLAEWALGKALAQCVRWRTRGFRNRVSVNLSARNLDDPDLPRLIAGLLAKHRADADWLTVELTEGSIMMDPERNTRTLEAIRDLGVRISIDDFGAGQSALCYLRRLPADEVKLDKSFILTMTVDKQDAAIVRSTIGLAHELGLSVVAEGVENEAALRLLRVYGCDFGQGFYLGRPESARAVSRRLATATIGTRSLSSAARAGRFG